VGSHPPRHRGGAWARAHAGLGVLACLLLAACATAGAPGQTVAPARTPISPLTASSTPFCDRAKVLDARQQDRILRFAAIVRDELAASGQAVALVSRSGTDLSRFGIRFSHAGIALRDGEIPWSVRQLYYACDEGRPLLFDQGIGGFLMNVDDPSSGFVSIVTMPPARADALAAAARDPALALRLLAATYSANAYPFSERYQNCNQWVMELIAAAWGDLSQGDALRRDAQHWLLGQSYQPTTIDVDSHFTMMLGRFVPLLHFDDHPEDDRLALRVRLSLPASIEGFVRQQAPGAQRVELCHDDRQVVVRRGWSPIADGCVPAPGDRVVPLD
jgi:hypothetical protein